MKKEREFKITINKQQTSVSVSVVENIEPILKEINTALRNLPLKESVTKEDLGHWADEIHDALFHSGSEKKPTDKQIYNHLTTLNKLLKKLEEEIATLPAEVRNLLSESDYLQDTYFQLFPNEYSISKSRFLVGLAQGNSAYLKGIQQKGEIKNEKGRKENLNASCLSDRLALIFFRSTEQRPTRKFDPTEPEREKQETGEYFNFVKQIFEIGNVPASVEDQVRKSTERFRESFMGLIEKK